MYIKYLKYYDYTTTSISEGQIHGTVVIGVTTLIKYNSYCSITSFVSIASITGVLR